LKGEGLLIWSNAKIGKKDFLETFDVAETTGWSEKMVHALKENFAWTPKVKIQITGDQAKFSFRSRTIFSGHPVFAGFFRKKIQVIVWIY
jgi:hypothetical protein